MRAFDGAEGGGRASVGHTITSGTPDKADRAFDLRLTGKGAAAHFEFARPGVFPYRCERHPAMRGEGRVD